jgi:DNA repair protein RadC
MANVMSLFTPLDKAPDPALAGFVPSEREDEVARLLLRPLFDDECEALLLAGFDAFQRLVRLEHIDGDTRGRCTIAPRRWRTLVEAGIATVLMAHNHPSGVASPSEADIAATHDAALFLRTMGIELIDHLIFVANGHFSFRSAEML